MALSDHSLNSFLHRLIPAGLRGKLKTNTAEYARVRALAVMLSVTTAVSTLIIVLVGGYHLLFEPELLGHDLSIVLIGLLLALHTGLFYRFENYWMSGLAFTSFYFLLVAVSVIMSGGYDSAGLPFLITCPMLAFLIGGRLEGIQSTIVLVVFCLAIVLLRLIDFQLPNVFREEDPHLIFAVNWISTLIVSATCIILYEVGLEKRNERLAPQLDITCTAPEGFRILLNHWVSKLVPLHLQKNVEHLSPQYARIRILSAMLAVATALSFLSAVILIIAHAIFSPQQLKYDVVIAGIFAFFCLQSWVFYKWNNVWLSSLILSYFYFFCILVLIITGGGYGAKIMILLVLSPIIFFMTGGIRNGIQNSLFVMIAGLFFAHLDHANFIFTNHFSGVSEPFIFSIVWSIAIVGVAICMLIYDEELEKLS